MAYDGGIRAMHEGAVAYRNGTPRQCNPYPQADAQHYDWSFGWDTAMTRNEHVGSDIH